MINLKLLNKRTYFLVIIYLAIITVASVVSAKRDGGNSLFDYVVNLRFGGTASDFVLLMGVFPLISIIIPVLIDQMEKEMFVLRIWDKKRVFKNHFIFSIIISVFFIIWMVASGVISSFIINGHINNLWQTREGTVYFLLEKKEIFEMYIPYFVSWKVWLYIIASRFLGILFMSLFILLLKTIIKKNTFIFFLALFLFGVDGLLPNDFSFFLGRMQITLDTWVSVEEKLFNVIYFLLGITICWYICFKRYEKKEFY
ncbi:hypothetical protein NSQ89_21620 [Niallia sp. FSL R7-0648]|uniref:hypothetical protein n=1 Tax=Niallia sp. FSL R7-0648 TaxID=2954521 RepID=UPI0030F8C78F